MALAGNHTSWPEARVETAKQPTVAPEEGLPPLPDPGTRIVEVDDMADLPLLPPGEQLASVTADFLQIARSADSNVLLVSSAKPGEGKTVNALNIAHGMATEAGLRPLLVDLNPDNPSLAAALCRPDCPGLTDVIQGKTGLARAIHHSTPLGVDFLPLGTPMKGRLQLFSGATGRKLVLILDRLASIYDYVLLDGPAVFATTDPSAIASQFGGVVMIVACENTRWEVFSAAERQLRDAGARPLGAVLNQRRYHVPRFVYGG